MIPPGTALVATLGIVQLVLLVSAGMRTRKRRLVDFAKVLPSSRGLWLCGRMMMLMMVLMSTKVCLLPGIALTANLARTVLLEEPERNKTPRGEHEDRRVLMRPKACLLPGIALTANLARTVLLEEPERNKTPRGEHEDRRVTSVIAVMVVLYQKPIRSTGLLVTTMMKGERADGVQGPRDPEWKLFLELNHLMGLNLLTLLVGTETKKERNADPPDPLDLE
jgi:hypothetical protein